MKKNWQRKNSFNKSLLIGLILFVIFFVFTKTTSLTDKIVENTTKINIYKEIGLSFLGFRKPINILLLFHNNAEQRHSGGFIGSVGYMKIVNGDIQPEPIRSVYYYDYVANDKTIYSETRLIDGRYQTVGYNLRNTAEYMNWPNNAAVAAKIFEIESGKKVDAVIGVTPEVIKFLLRKTGPLKLDNYDKFVTADNFMETVQLEVESGIDKANLRDPKTILSDLGNKIIEIYNRKNLLELIGVIVSLKDLIYEHQIVLYSTDGDTQKYLDEIGASGALINFDGDYIAISETSRFGTKSGPYVKRELQRSVKIDNTGGILIDMTLTRTHLADSYLYRYYDPLFKGYKYLVAADSVDIKLALPKGSKLINISTPIKQRQIEKNYDIYLFEMTVEPRQTQTVKLQYTLPIKQAMTSTLTYNSYKQWQTGAYPVIVQDCLQTPTNYILVSANQPLLRQLPNNEVCYNTTTNRDIYISTVYAQQE